VTFFTIEIIIYWNCSLFVMLIMFSKLKIKKSVSFWNSIVENHNILQINKTYFDIFFMNVQKLNSDWIDVKVSNQKLNETMIDDLCNSFTAEIRWITVNDKMKVMCMKKKFIKIITHYDMKTFKKKELKITDEIFRIIIKNMLTQIKNKKSDNFVIISFWSKTDSLILNAD